MEETFAVSFVESPLQECNVLIVHGASSKEEFNRCMMAHWFRNDWSSIPGKDGQYDLAFKTPKEFNIDQAIEARCYEWVDDSKKRVRSTI